MEEKDSTHSNKITYETENDYPYWCMQTEIELKCKGVWIYLKTELNKSPPGLRRFRNGEQLARSAEDQTSHNTAVKCIMANIARSKTMRVHDVLENVAQLWLRLKPVKTLKKLTDVRDEVAHLSLTNHKNVAEYIDTVYRLMHSLRYYSFIEEHDMEYQLVWKAVVGVHPQHTRILSKSVTPC